MHARLSRGTIKDKYIIVNEGNPRYIR